MSEPVEGGKMVEGISCTEQRAKNVLPLKFSKTLASWLGDKGKITCSHYCDRFLTMQRKAAFFPKENFHNNDTDKMNHEKTTALKIVNSVVAYYFPDTILCKQLKKRG